MIERQNRRISLSLAATLNPGFRHVQQGFAQKQRAIIEPGKTKIFWVYQDEFTGKNFSPVWQICTNVPL